MLQVNQTGLTIKPPKLTVVPQLKKADAAQSKNNAGGYSFTLTPMKQLERFLVMGSMGGTFYVGKNKLTTQNLNAAIGLLQANPQIAQSVVDKAVSYSVNGRVITNDTCLAILAAASAYAPSSVKSSLPAALTQVARTGTDLLHFTGYADSFRGWGTSLKKLVSNWFLSKTPDQVAYQAVKYFNRDGWTQRDVLRKSHTKTHDPVLNGVFRYIAHKDKYSEDQPLPAIIKSAEYLKKHPTEDNAVRLIKEVNLPREAIPTELLGSVKVWEALLYRMKGTALIRNLNKMTAIGLLKPLSDHTKYVVNTLSNEDWIKKEKVHPIKLLFAQKTYAKGTGDKGSLVWSPVSAITEAVENAFYLSFNHAKPTGKKLVLGLDISGSMGTNFIGGIVTCREASFAMAMATAKVESQYYALAFDSMSTVVDGQSRLMTRTNGVKPIDIRKATRLSDYESVCGKWAGGGTDCALPMIHARVSQLDVDGFIIYTDNETWAGGVHPHVALRQYNEAMGKNAKLIVVGMTSTNFSIAKQDDPNMLDVVGFDTATPELISAFLQD